MYVFKYSLSHFVGKVILTIQGPPLKVTFEVLQSPRPAIAEMKRPKITRTTRRSQVRSAYVRMKIFPSSLLVITLTQKKWMCMENLTNMDSWIVEFTSIKPTKWSEKIGKTCRQYEGYRFACEGCSQRGGTRRSTSKGLSRYRWSEENRGVFTHRVWLYGR